MRKRLVLITGLVLVIAAAATAAGVKLLSGGVHVTNGKAEVSLSEGIVRLGNGSQQLNCNLSSGQFEYLKAGTKVLGGMEASVQLADKTYSTGKALKRTVLKERTGPVEDSFGKGVKVAIDNEFDGIHVVQLFSVYADKPYILVQAEVSQAGADVSTNHISPLVQFVSKGSFCDLNIGKTEDPRALFVPFDNDKWVKFEANPLNMAHKSYEATAVYDAAGRQGLVLGSVDHDTWKTAIDLEGEKEGLTRLEVYGGAADTQTRDTQPHGKVTGKTVASPRIFLGMFEDYRTGLEEYGKANAASVKPLEWDGGAIFGWNSWYAASSKVDAATYLNAAGFIKEKLQPEGFANEDNTVYINFDSFWDNLSESELIEVAEKIHANGQKAGIYWTPFVYWGNDVMQPVEGADGAVYGDILLKDPEGKLLPPIAGGLPVDPTHPAQIQRMEYRLGQFVKWGYDFVKLDFMTHGALEGVHYDKNITTGIQAYNFGMEKLRSLLSKEKIGRSFFISESIAPLFPYQYAHARRISCDVFNELKDSEYMLNSMTYGWWQKEFYHYLDGDMVCLHKREDGATSRPEEALMRVNSNTVTGGLYLLGDSYNFAAISAKPSETLPGTPEAVERSEGLLTNKTINDIMKKGVPFLPVEGNIRNGACDTYVLKDKDCSYLALFNFSPDKSKSMDIDLARAGLDGSRTYELRDIWTGKAMAVTGSLQIDLIPGGSTIIQLK